MSNNVLKGNFETKKNVEIEEAEESATAKFERAAKKRLGGSIAYVKKADFLFGAGDEAKEKDGAGSDD